MGKKDKSSSAAPRDSSPHKPYTAKRFEIPERTSSLMPQSAQQTLISLDKQQSVLKRKASEMSQRLHSSYSMEFLDLRQEQIQNHEQQFLALHKGLRETFQVGSIDRTEYKKEVKKCWTKRAKLTAESLTITRHRARLAAGLDAEKETKEPDWLAAYAELLTNLYKSHERPAGWETRNDHIDSAWRQGLIEHYNAEDSEHYNAEDPEDKPFLWCPIMRVYRDAEYRTAAHIVPHSIGYSNAGYLFGEPDDGSGLIWSFRNGIVMARTLETQFDKGDFVLVPVESSNPGTEPCEWRFVLMNENLRKHDVGDSSTKYDDLDGRLLEWKNENRPARRFLYYHFVTTVLRYVRYEKPGWAEKRMTVPTGKLWATQGPYLRRSTLKHLAAMLGDVDEGDEMFADGVFDRKDGKPESEERRMAQEIFVAHERTKLEEEDIQIEAEEQGVDAVHDD